MLSNIKNEKAITEKFNTNLLNELDGLKEKIIDLKELTPEILNRFMERVKVLRC
ncbi:hypothetical protein CLK_2785 [Clostridium botulinum A3 str. Loch Maree]|nr:hypothetical protein CLK_2785 [Clostridium botulinum A3 str. Loch Maree]